MAAHRSPAPASFVLDRTALHRLHTLSKLIDRVTQAAYRDEVGLPLGEGRCLAAVGAFRPLSVVDLARRANLDKGQASRAAQSLVDQGLVRKDANRSDGRGVVLTLTARGERTWQKVMALVDRRNEEILGGLSATERKVFEKALERLVDQAREAAGSGDEE